MSGSQTRPATSRLAASFAGSAVRPAPPLTEQPDLSPEMRVSAVAAVRPAAAPPRIKQTVELPEDVYEAVQDFARERRTSFQVVMRALIDDLVGAGDESHRARLDALVQVAERDKRDRRRNRGRVRVEPARSTKAP